MQDRPWSFQSITFRKGVDFHGQEQEQFKPKIVSQDDGWVFWVCRLENEVKRHCKAAFFSVIERQIFYWDQIGKNLLGQMTISGFVNRTFVSKHIQ